MSDTPQVLLAHHLKALKLPSFLREYDKLARQCAADAVDHVRYLLRLAELELDELGYVPLSQSGAELLFEVFSQRYERGSTIVTSNLPFDEWTGVFASERLTGALLDRLTHHVHILEMNGDSYRLKQSKQRQRRARSADASDHPSEA
jgi:DNA replication protein DnaC